MSVAIGSSLLKQIDDELQLIQAKLRDGTATGSNLGALTATLKTNIDVSAALLVTLLDAGNAGTGLGPIASMQQADLTSFFVDAIAAET